MVDNTFDRLTKRLNEKAQKKEQERQKVANQHAPVSIVTKEPRKVRSKQHGAMPKVNEDADADASITLPSKDVISIRQEYIDTSLCRVWEGNNRSDESRNDQSLEELKSAILAQGQMIPGFVRPVNDGSPFKYEVIYGSRRFTACLELEIPFLAQVGIVSDKDALIMMDAENNARKELSVYEKAISYHDWLKQGYFKDRADLARHLGVSVGWLSKIQSVLKLPEEVVSAFPNKTVIKVWWAVELLRLVKSSEEMKYQLIKSALNIPSKLKSAEAVYSYLLKCTNEKAFVKKETNKKASSEKFKIKNNEGKFICDLIKESNGQVKVMFSKDLQFDDIKSRLEGLYSNDATWEF